MALPWAVYLYSKAWSADGELIDTSATAAKLSHEFTHRRRQGSFLAKIWWFVTYIIWPWSRLDEELIAAAFAVAAKVIRVRGGELEASEDVYADAAEILWDMEISTSQGGWRLWYCTPGSPGHHVTTIRSYAARIIHAYYSNDPGEVLEILHTPRSELTRLIAAP